MTYTLQRGKNIENHLSSNILIRIKVRKKEQNKNVDVFSSIQLITH